MVKCPTPGSHKPRWGITYQVPNRELRIGTHNGVQLQHWKPLVFCGSSRFRKLSDPLFLVRHESAKQGPATHRIAQCMHNNGWLWREGRFFDLACDNQTYRTWRVGARNSGLWVAKRCGDGGMGMGMRMGGGGAHKHKQWCPPRKRRLHRKYSTVYHMALLRGQLSIGRNPRVCRFTATATNFSIDPTETFIGHCQEIRAQ